MRTKKPGLCREHNSEHLVGACKKPKPWVPASSKVTREELQALMYECQEDYESQEWRLTSQTIGRGERGYHIEDKAGSRPFGPNLRTARQMADVLRSHLAFNYYAAKIAHEEGY